MRTSTQRLIAAAETTLAPGERVTSTGVAWAAARRDTVPLLFQARRQYWVVLTDRRLLVFDRRRGGPGPHDLVFGKRFDFFELEGVKRVRPLLQVRVKGANGSRQVLEFRPAQRGLGSELVAQLKGAGAPPPARDGWSDPGEPAADTTTVAFWGER